MNTRHTTKSLLRKDVISYKLQKDSLQINYWKGGSGPVLVFVHGFGGNAAGNWAKELQHYAKTNTVIAYDLLWFDESFSNEIPNLSTQTRALDLLLTELNISKATFIGQSYGGFVIVDYAYKYYPKVEKLVVANSPGPTFDIAYLDTVCQNFGLKNIADLFILENPNDIQRLSNAASFSDKHIPKFIRNQIFDVYFNKHNAEQLALMRSLPADQKRISDFTIFKNIPTMVLWGENDEIFPLKEGRKFAAAINAKFVSIPNCGHGPQVDQHREFIRILDGFLLPNE